ncbi:methionyl-tRNA formyltransferase [Halovenus salina]|uniref:methionyl-tRNA formyltransferase n=1 Tax=Halovenus salina TaxID=1510225 RepID=UPI002260E727|nr:formyltransferase family protein [Halovenus salina]
MTDVAFFGSHPLGERCLQLLDDTPDIDISVVVTYPKKYDSWWAGSVHERALEFGYPVLEPDDERGVLNYEVDYIVSVYYPNILGEELLQHPDDGALNLHQAELPRYQGSNVFSHSIMNARDDDYWKHGTTIHFMAEEVDAGDVVDRRFVDITEEDTARSLYEKTREASAALFEETLPQIVSGEVHEMRTPQSEFNGPTYFYYKSSLDGKKEIPLEELADPADERALYDKIRALDFPPFKPAHTTVGGTDIHLTKSSYEEFGEMFRDQESLF